ncbi:MAG: dUTP diphosphatase [Alphaproteobacteria bacterium]|tara:strand:+ start:572 stop:1015 length:444 start_codon:yes stop_codon:yes gene_type:complete
MNKILFKTLNNGKTLYNLHKATSGSAGFDLVAAIEQEIIIKPSETKLIPAGFSLEMPNNFEAQVRPRSGIALKNSVTVLNSPGTIDSDYRGEVGVILINHGFEKFSILRGMRIAQIIFLKLPEIEIVESQKLSKTKRNDGGFGSTGI